MEGTHNITPSGNCRLRIIMSMHNRWRAQQTQGTLENIPVQGVYLNPPLGHNGLKISLWDV